MKESNEWSRSLVVAVASLELSLSLSSSCGLFARAGCALPLRERARFLIV